MLSKEDYNQHRLIIAGLAQCDVGLTNVLNAIIESLKHSWEILVFAHGTESNNYKKIKGVKTELSFLQDWSQSTQVHFEKIIKDYKPDVILIIGHPWKSPKFTAVASKYPNAKLVVYMPIEGRPIGKHIATSLTGVDLCITYTKFAQNALKSLLSKPDTKLISIGHGLDTYYQPLTSNKLPAETSFREALRKRLFPNHPEYWKRPMVLNSNRLYYRKRLDLTIKGFALAAKKTDASLYLNIAAITQYEHNKLETLIKKLGIESRVMLNTLNTTNKPIPKEQLRQLYNACDIGITTSMGEGWGLCVFEHAATGAMQIVPDHTAFRENWPDKTALKFTAKKPVYVADEAAEMYEGSIEDISNVIIKAIKNQEYRTLYGYNGFKHAHSEQFNWFNIGKTFDQALKSILIAI
ncbi:hypothetical protein A9Q86_15865 [Flavobacteriales bacterium 33_180_T64]|nr:hypothetical protein A9Q86_15865 [Flavobacteriales bacterium 33_180_T64]